MFLSPLRALTDYLNDSTNGVNAQLAVMATEGLFDGSDSAPENINVIVDETRDIEVARRFPPLEASGEDKPSLSVFIIDPVNFGAPGQSGGSPEVAQSTRDYVVQFAVRYYIHKPQTAAALRDMHYYLRATMKSIKAFNRNSTARTRNNIIIHPMVEAQYIPVFQDEQFGGLTWYLLLTYRLRDQRP